MHKKKKKKKKCTGIYALEILFVIIVKNPDYGVNELVEHRRYFHKSSAGLEFMFIVAKFKNLFPV